MTDRLPMAQVRQRRIAIGRSRLQSPQSWRLGRSRWTPWLHHPGPLEGPNGVRQILQRCTTAFDLPRCASAIAEAPAYGAQPVQNLPLSASLALQEQPLDQHALAS